jgi:hypothetical protein
MKPCRARLALVVCLACLTASVVAQSAPAASASQPDTVIPQMVRFSGTLLDPNGKPLTGIVGVTFALYKDQQGGAPLWLETQNVRPDGNGRYAVMLGSTTAAGLPADVFSSGDARWLGVQPAGQPEQPRVMLLSVPYALKAGDAQTLGGLPPSAFMLSVATTSAPTTPSAAATGSSTPPPPTAKDVTTTGGTVNALPLFSTATNIQNSILTQTGAGATGKIGVNIAAPGATLDVNGTANIRGSLTLPTTGNATAAAGKNSQPQDFIASVFNKTTSTAVPQKFQWQAQPAANNTANASGTLNLLYASGTAAPAQTGLSISSKGVLTFAPGQIFPGTGPGTITDVAAGTGLTGGGASGSVSLALASKSCAAGNAISALPFTCSPFATLGANSFSGNQTVNGSLSATGVATGSLTASGTVQGAAVNSASGYEIGGSVFDYGSATTGNSFLGFAGNLTSTGNENVGVGYQTLAASTTGGENTGIGFRALSSNTGGFFNTAVGGAALATNVTGSDNTAVGTAASQNTTGANNTAVGFRALENNTTGTLNTAVGSFAEVGSSGLTNATAIGANAIVSASNALVLGSTGSAAVNVGIGTATPTARLAVIGSETTANGSGAGIQLTNTASGGMDYYFRVGATGTNTSAGSLSIANDDEYIMTMTANGNIGLQTQSPTNIFTIVQGGGQAIADGWTTYSSRRWKTNIHPLTGALAKVERLQGVSYDLKTSGKHEIGVIAEEVGNVVPEVVTYEQNGKDARGVDYSRLTALLIEAVKQQQKEIATQARQISAEQRQIRRQQRLVSAEQRQIAHLNRKIGALQVSLRDAASSNSSVLESRTTMDSLPIR